MAGCARSTGAPPSPPPATPPSSACIVAGDSVGPARSITAAFDDPADAARARIAATRLAPVRLDCEDRPLPGLADRWSVDTSVKFWTLELSAGHATPATTSERWTAATLAAAWRSDPDADLTLRSVGVESVLPLDDRRLVVGFAVPQRAVPRVFASRTLAVALSDSSTLMVESPASGDLRDAVDGGVDVVETGNPDLLEYAGSRPGLHLAALPWSRLYFLLLPAGSAGLGDAIPEDTAAFTAALARNAVRTDARAAGPSSWIDSAARCPTSAVPTRSATSNSVVYPATDGTAREVAERVVALAGPLGLVARPLAADSLSAALLRGDARAFVLSAPRTAAGPCAESSRWPAGGAVVALLETRRHVIVRRGTPRLIVEWDGAVRVAQPGDTVGAAP